MTFDFKIDFDQTKNKSSDTYKSKTLKFLEMADIRVSNFNKSNYQILEHVIENIKIPEKKEQIRIRTQQQINLISLVLKILQKHKKIDELTIATYTFNRISWNTITDALKSGKIKKINLFLSSSYAYRDKKYYMYLQEQAKELSLKYDIHLVFAGLHLKITLIQCKKDYYLFEGSMNYSTNNMAENLLFENNKKSYLHDYEFFTNFLKQKKNKALKIIC